MVPDLGGSLIVRSMQVCALCLAVCCPVSLSLGLTAVLPLDKVATAFDLSLTRLFTKKA